MYWMRIHLLAGEGQYEQVFLGKKDYQEGIPSWLPLFQHLDDTRFVSGLLWEHWLCRGQKNIVTIGVPVTGKNL